MFLGIGVFIVAMLAFYGFQWYRNRHPHYQPVR
jgi:hypothetical protein